MSAEDSARFRKIMSVPRFAAEVSWDTTNPEASIRVYEEYRRKILLDIGDTATSLEAVVETVDEAAQDTPLAA
jgi:hypothetical protein